jgi:hypothetical protein
VKESGSLNIEGELLFSVLAGILEVKVLAVQAGTSCLLEKIR